MDKIRLYIAIGRQLSAIRTQAGLTQTALAKQIGVSTQMLNKLEQGEQSPPVHVLYRAAHALDVSLDTLVPDPS